MKKILTLVLMLAMPAAHAAALEKPVLPTKSTGAFSKERETELHVLRRQVITGYIKGEVFLCHRDIALHLHNTWCQNKIECDNIAQYIKLWEGREEPTKLFTVESVLQSLTSLDQSIYTALKEHVPLTDAKKDEKKS